MNKVSYALGMSVANNILASGVKDLNIEEFANAIKAVLYPADTNYYFFCADTRTDEKIVYYAETDEQHDQNRILAGLA